MVHVIDALCPQNHPCPVANLCPVEAISQNGYAAPEVDDDLCTECGLCTSYCPAFRMHEGEAIR